MDEGHFYYESLQVDDDEEDDESSTEGKQIWRRRTSECQVYGTPLARLGDQEVNQTDEGSLKFNTVLG